MRIVYHLGTHCTDEERLLRCLLKNRGVLASEGIVVPGPAKYRNLMRDTAMALKGQPADRDTQALVLDQIMTEDEAERLILSWDNFMGYAPGAVREVFYGSAGDRMHAFCQVFPGIETEFHLAIRNPATFIPAMFLKQRGRNIEEFLEGVDPETLRWSDLIASLRRANPSVAVTVWCDEDTPLLWPEVLQTVSGHSEDLLLEDCDDLLASIMSADGMQRMASYVATHPPQNVVQRRRIVSAFLDKFALPEKIDVELDFPGWTESRIDALSDSYDQDVSRIMAMDGVKVLVP
jgi:hypothetical protein